MSRKFLSTFLFFLFFTLPLTADVFDKIYEKDLIHVGVRYEHKPLAFINKKGKIDGFEIDLVKFIADKLNVRVKFHQINSKNRINYLKNGKVDFVIASMDMKNTRGVDISNEYFYEKTVLLLQNKVETKSIDDVAIKIIATIKGEKTDYYLLKEVPDARIVYFREYPQAIRSLDKKNISAVLANASWAQEMLKKYPYKFKIIATDLYDLSYVIGVKKGEKRLLELLESAMRSCVKDGIYEETYQKWFFKKASILPKI